jgi:Amt family ammonium transporter
MLDLVAGIVVYVAVNLVEWVRIDDRIGAVPVHGACGIWGTLSLGLFASGQFGATGPMGADNSSPVTGLFYGGGSAVLKAQFIGSLTITVTTFVIAFILMWVVKQLPYPWKLRVEPEGETGEGGLDMFEHGIEAYPAQ